MSTTAAARRRRRVRSGLVAIVLLAACERVQPPAAAPEAPVSPWTAERVGAEVAFARAGCVRCHDVPEAQRARWASPRGPDLADAVRWRADDGGAAFLRRHHGGADADDLAAWVASLGAASVPPVERTVSAARVARGEQLVRERACRACHTPAELGGVAARVDLARLAVFLATPGARHPGLVHPPLTAAEAEDTAAWLLRDRIAAGDPVQGFAWSAWLREIDDPRLPELDGEEPAARGVAAVIDAKPAPREHHYALRFDATIDVPAAGEWTFVAGSDDSSWLWVDGELVVRNEGLEPHRRRSGTTMLAAGPHDLRVVFTQAAGGASLEVLWRGPGVDEQPVPASRALAGAARAVPPPERPAPAADAVARGRAAARARRCDACHTVADAELAASPPAPVAPPWERLRDAPCPHDPAGQTLAAAARDARELPFGAAAELATALLRDGCLACHARDGNGGLPPAVRAQLRDVEDLGDEGRVPPDLTGVGRRLRPAWLRKVLADGHSVRPYLRVRMPALGADRAERYARWFAAVDGGDPRPEPPFSPEAAELGRALAGSGGRNCITCHTCQGHAATGTQGMDLVIQHERLQPGWFSDWVVNPSRLRPHTRMPAAWLRDDAAARADVAALRTWTSLGAAAPLPTGVRPRGEGLVIDPIDRPRLHGAFLDGVSARCLAVGTPQRAHWAWDLTGPRLVWTWRGAFLDAKGTWVGRAGKLLRPLGGDWRVVADFALAGEPARALRGQRITADGYPVLRVAAGDAEYEDELRPRLAATGAELVRTLRVRRGTLDFVFPERGDGPDARVGDAPAGRHSVAAGDVLEVVYRW